MGSGTSVEFPIDDLPEEVLVAILSFCPDHFLINTASYVCKKWRDISRGQTLWRLKCQRGGVTIPDELPVEYRDYRKLYKSNVFGRNLLKNWDAGEGLKHWMFRGEPCHANSGIVTEDSTPRRSYGSEPLSELDLGAAKCWAFSYWLERLMQQVDLIKSGLTPEILDDLQPPITVSVWTAARRDCASQYSLTVTLLGDVGADILAQFEDSREVGQWDDNSWVKISHTFRSYGKDVRRLNFVNSGKDKQFWAGNYGPKVGCPSVRVGWSSA